MSSSSSLNCSLLAMEAQEQMYVKLTTFWFYFLAFITTAGLLVSLISNMIIIYLFTRTQSLRKNPSNIIGVNLSLSDLLYCIQWPSVIYCCLTQSSRILEHKLVCQVFGFITASTALASILTVLVMSVERALVIKYPLKMKNILTIKMARLVLVVIWIISLCSCIPPLFGRFNRYTLDPSRTSCTLDYLSGKANYKLYILALYVAYWIAPTIIISISYAIIIITFKKSSTSLSKISDRKDSQMQVFGSQADCSPSIQIRNLEPNRMLNEFRPTGTLNRFYSLVGSLKTTRTRSTDRCDNNPNLQMSSIQSFIRQNSERPLKRWQTLRRLKRTSSFTDVKTFPEKFRPSEASTNSHSSVTNSPLSRAPTNLTRNFMVKRNSNCSSHGSDRFTMKTREGYEDQAPAPGTNSHQIVPMRLMNRSFDRFAHCDSFRKNFRRKLNRNNRSRTSDDINAGKNGSIRTRKSGRLFEGLSGSNVSDSGCSFHSGNPQMTRTALQIRLAKMSFYLLMLWLVSWTPIASLAMINSIQYCHRASATAVVMASTMTKLGPAFDVFIYGISHPKIKSRFKSIIKGFFTSSYLARVGR